MKFLDKIMERTRRKK